MDDTQKMLRTIINGQSTFRQEVMSRIDRLDEKFEGKIDSLDKKMGRMEKNLTSLLTWRMMLQPEKNLIV